MKERPEVGKGGRGGYKPFVSVKVVSISHSPPGRG